MTEKTNITRRIETMKTPGMATVHMLRAKPWFEDTCLQMLLVLGPPPGKPDAASLPSKDFWDSRYRADYVARYLARGRWIGQAEDYLQLRHKNHIPFAYIAGMILAFELWLKEREDEQKRDA